MSKVIKLSDQLVIDATVLGKANHRTPARQIEYWAKIGKIAEENPELPLSFVKDILIAMEESAVSDVPGANQASRC